MVTKSKKGSTGTKKGRVKSGKLKLNKETVKDLTSEQQKMVRGGLSLGQTKDCTIASVCRCSASLCIGCGLVRK